MNSPISLFPLTLGDSRFLCSTAHYFVQEAKPSSTTPMPHIHDCYEIYVNYSGDVSFLVGDRIYAVESGDIIIAKPRQMHASLIHSPCVYESYCFWFLSTVPSALTDFAERAGMHRHLRFPKQQRERLKEIMVRLHQTEKDGNELERTAWVYHLLAFLNGSAEPEQFGIPAVLPEPMQQVLSYIDKHFAHIRTAEEIADTFFISTATLNRWFRTWLHISPKAYLETRRLSCAKALLAQGSSVTQTAISAGFPNCSRFIAVFKQAFGITPLQYQKTLHAHGFIHTAGTAADND